MRKITARIVHFFIESKVIDETDREIYEYGLEILSENVMLTVFLLLFGVAIGRGVETGIFFVLVLMDEMVLEVQVWLNKTYNVGVVEDRNTGQ